MLSTSTFCKTAIVIFASVTQAVPVTEEASKLDVRETTLDSGWRSAADTGGRKDPYNATALDQVLLPDPHLSALHGNGTPSDDSHENIFKKTQEKNTSTEKKSPSTVYANEFDDNFEELHGMMNKYEKPDHISSDGIQQASTGLNLTPAQTEVNAAISGFDNDQVLALKESENWPAGRSPTESLSREESSRTMQDQDHDLVYETNATHSLESPTKAQTSLFGNAFWKCAFRWCCWNHNDCGSNRRCDNHECRNLLNDWDICSIWDSRVCASKKCRRDSRSYGRCTSGKVGQTCDIDGDCKEGIRKCRGHRCVGYPRHAIFGNYNVRV